MVPWKTVCQTLLMMTLGSSSWPKITHITKKKCVPIIIHGDGVPCTNNHSLDAISFESILAKRGMGTACSTLDYIVFITVVFTQTIDSVNAHGLGKTKTQLWKLIMHSLRACYYGYWSEQDPLDNDVPAKSLNSKERTHETNGPIISWGPPWENGWAKWQQCGKPGSSKNAGQGGRGDRYHAF